MTEIMRIAIDTSKSVFTLHGVDAAGRAVLRRNLRRRELLRFFETLAPVEVALEACGGALTSGLLKKSFAAGFQDRIVAAVEGQLDLYGTVIFEFGRA